MLIGQLDQRITLQSPVTKNNRGERSISYYDEAKVPARVITERGTEAFEAARISASKTIRVLIRYRSDILTSWRLVWEGESYNITAVDTSQRRQGELWLTAQVVR